MKTVNKKISESKRIIKEEKKKIKEEKKNIKRKKREKFKKTWLGKFLGKFIYIFSEDKDSYTFSEVFMITIFSLLLGGFACFSLFVIVCGGRNALKFTKTFSKLYDAYTLISENYYEDVNDSDLVDAAVNGMVSSVGDAYTNYGSSEYAEDFDELVEGTYEGIGCTIQQTEDSIKVIDVYEDSPADKAGLKSGDLIKKVDDKDALETGVNDLATYIKTEAEGKITMVISRDDKEMTITLERGKVEVPAIDSEIYEKNDKKIGYLSISIFSSVSANQFKNKLKELEDEGIDALVIDVRDNNGGYLNQVTSMLNMLLPKGNVLYQVQGENKTSITKDNTKEKRSYPIAVITNGSSASASEIMAAAIKESYKGYVVGTKTFGKGTVQQVKKLSDGSMIKYTVEKWLTPDGNWINNEGVEPTDVVELSDEYYANPTEENDTQLQKALELVSK